VARTDGRRCFTGHLFNSAGLAGKGIPVSQEQTLQQLLTERVTVFATGERPTAIIDQHVEKMFVSVIDDCFRSYGELAGKVRESIKAAMPANVEGLFELTRYNDLVATALRDKWASSGIAGDMVRRAQESIDEIMKEDAVPAQVSLRDLLEAFVEAHKEQAVDGRWECPRIDIEDEGKGSSWHSIHISFDPQPDEAYASERSSYSLRTSTRERYQLENSISIRVDGENEAGHPFGRVYSARLEGHPVGRSFRLYQKWERLLAALYFGAAAIVVDCDADGVSYGIYD
jgi:hypothetical protein